MDVKQTYIPGCLELILKPFKDERGTFVKTFHHDLFAANKLITQFAEEYYTFSRHGVLRGLHFQVPPMDHVKVVCCISGSVLDAVLDLRKGSPTYGGYELFELSAEKANMLYIPTGLAHGFYVTGDHAVMLYKVTTLHSPPHDAGIRWDSAGIAWPNAHPIISPRDRGFPSLADFSSPFIFEENRAI